MLADDASNKHFPASVSDGPVSLDGIVSAEKLGELRALETEYPALDFKTTIDLTQTSGEVELAKDVGAMQVRGGYILGGVNATGAPTGALDAVDPSLFDEARLAPKLLKYLPAPLELRTNVLRVDGHVVVLIYVGRHPSGCAIFKAKGAYEKNGREKVVFREGEIFWRDGTRSVRVSQHGLEEIIGRRVIDEKAVWVAEQQEIRRRDQNELERSYQSRRRAQAPLGALSFELPPSELSDTALELLRADDDLGLRRIFLDGLNRARAAIESNDLDTSLADVLDKLACLAATFLIYEQRRWFQRVVEALLSVYSMPAGERDGQRFGYSTRIDPREKAPRVWLLVVERIFALGALAVRLEDWWAVRELAVQKPDRITTYETTWLRHALTMASRANHLEEVGDSQQNSKLSLLSFARNQAARLPCLRLDGLQPDADEIITSLARFDVLANLAAIDAARAIEPRVFYPNFARFRQDRIQPVVDRLLTDAAMRKIVFRGADVQLAEAFAAIGKIAEHEGWMSDGFRGWAHTSVGAFLTEQLPASEQ